MREIPIAWTTAGVYESGKITTGYVIAYGAVSPDGRAYILPVFYPKGNLIVLANEWMPPEVYNEYKGVTQNKIGRDGSAKVVEVLDYANLVQEGAGRFISAFGDVSVTIDALYKALNQGVNSPYTFPISAQNGGDNLDHYTFAYTPVDIRLAGSEPANLGQASNIESVLGQFDGGASLAQAQDGATDSTHLPIYSAEQWSKALGDGTAAAYASAEADGKNQIANITVIGDVVVATLDQELQVRQHSDFYLRFTNGQVLTVPQTHV